MLYAYKFDIYGSNAPPICPNQKFYCSMIIDSIEINSDGMTHDSESRDYYVERYPER